LLNKAEEELSVQTEISQAIRAAADVTSASESVVQTSQAQSFFGNEVNREARPPLVSSGHCCIRSGQLRANFAALFRDAGYCS
jgi:hypothetical protein